MKINRFTIFVGFIITQIIYSNQLLRVASHVPLRLISARALHSSSHALRVNYSVNCMWINSRKNLLSFYIHPGSKEEVRNKLIPPLIEWAKVTNGTVGLWYDSKMATSYAINNTKELLHKELTSSMAPVEFHDIRTLEYVKKYPHLFSSKMKVYFRADLLRIIATVETLKKQADDFNFVYSDLDITQVLKSDQLFDDSTQEFLKKYGIALASSEGCSLGDFENGFHIVSNSHPHIKEALQYVLIDNNIKRAQLFYDKNSNRYEGDMVYRSYDSMLKYLKYLMGKGTLQIGNEKYSQLLHGSRIFGPLVPYDLRLDPRCYEVPINNKVKFPRISGDYN